MLSSTKTSEVSMSPKVISTVTSENNVSIDTPYIAALLCGFSYKNLVEDNLEVDGIKFVNVEFYDINNIQFFTCQKENEDALYVVFRGTDSIMDMMVNFTISRVQTGFGKIHKGFLNSWLTVREEILSRIFKDDILYSTIKFFGHSYGGALANIAAVYIGSLTTKKIHCQTFGCPRVGNNHFCRSSRQYIDVKKRFIDKDDPIIHLPIFIRFTHSATPIVLRSTGVFSKFIHYYKLYLRKERFFEAHRIQHYIDLTQNYQQNYTKEE